MENIARKILLLTGCDDGSLGEQALPLSVEMPPFRRARQPNFSAVRNMTNQTLCRLRIGNRFDVGEQHQFQAASSFMGVSRIASKAPGVGGAPVSDPAGRTGILPVRGRLEAGSPPYPSGAFRQ
jgi:hypothetical protein